MPSLSIGFSGGGVAHAVAVIASAAQSRTNFRIMGVSTEWGRGTPRPRCHALLLGSAGGAFKLLERFFGIAPDVLFHLLAQFLVLRDGVRERVGVQPH